MDTEISSIFLSRLRRVIGLLDSGSFQSLHDLKHELECIGAAASTLMQSQDAYVQDGMVRFTGFVVSAVEQLENTICSSREGIQLACELTHAGLVGRPSYIIPVEQLLYLAEQGFTAVQMGEMIGTSTRTIQRRLAENNIRLGQRFSNLSDVELDNLVLNIISNFPNVGYRSVRGHLARSGHTVQETRVRESMRRVDVEGVLCRTLRLNPTHRRRYSVPSPNSLWHVDGYHKLIRYCTTCNFII